MLLDCKQLHRGREPAKIGLGFGFHGTLWPLALDESLNAISHKQLNKFW